MIIEVATKTEGRTRIDGSVLLKFGLELTARYQKTSWSSMLNLGDFIIDGAQEQLGLCYYVSTSLFSLFVYRTQKKKFMTLNALLEQSS